LFCMLTAAYGMLSAKRMTALIANFRLQSFFLFVLTLREAAKAGNAGLYIVAGLLFAVKVLAIPVFLFKIAKNIKVSENLGLLVNSQLSLAAGFLFTWGGWAFSRQLFGGRPVLMYTFTAVAFAVMAMGMFLMMFRMAALAQIVGLLVMENALFLLCEAVSGGMPFFVEFAIFFDVLVSVIILGIFVYRINKLFTHINVNKLTNLRG